MATPRLCSIPDCGKRHDAYGYCRTHGARWKRHGNPLGGAIPQGEAGRYLREIVLKYEGNKCLPWPYGTNSYGYGHVYVDGKVRRVTRVVCEKVNGPPPTPKHEAAHSCGNGHLRCCTKRHLSWKTSAGNSADRLIHGTHDRGERNVNAKLTEAAVREIRTLDGQVSQREFARRFGVSVGTVQCAIYRRSWAWLT